MRRELAIEFSRVTEAAALASYRYIGRGKKELADDAAVKAMRHMLNTIEIDGEVVIGEGEIDNAPMLYIGEKVGLGGDRVEIAVDPIDGTRMVALGQENAVAVMVVSDIDNLLRAPDMYMEKIMVPFTAKGVIDIDMPILENVKNVANAMGKKVSDMTVMTLAKPRHEQVIKDLQAADVKVIAIPDGDVAGSIMVAMPDADIDMFYGIGGAPEGVISAAIMRSLAGDMQAKLVLRTDCKGTTAENLELSKMEAKRCADMGVEVNTKLSLDDLCKTDNIVMSVTGITDGTLLSGVVLNGNLATTETLMIRGKSRTIRRINSTHFMERKDEEIKNIIKE